MNYIFDFDGTLSDFNRSKSEAKALITPFLEEKGVNTDDYWKHYEEIFETLFSRYIDNELSVEEYRIMRFLHHGIGEEDAKKFNGIYLDVTHKPILFDDVIPCFKELKNRGDSIYILTNGPESQRPKIESTAITEYVDGLFISSEMGFGKPDVRAYEYALERIGKKESCVMVGDNYENDCAAAERAGIPAIQIIRYNDTPVLHYRYIKSLNELTQGNVI